MVAVAVTVEAAAASPSAVVAAPPPPPAAASAAPEGEAWEALGELEAELRQRRDGATSARALGRAAASTPRHRRRAAPGAPPLAGRRRLPRRGGARARRQGGGRARAEQRARGRAERRRARARARARERSEATPAGAEERPRRRGARARRPQVSERAGARERERERERELSHRTPPTLAERGLHHTSTFTRAARPRSAARDHSSSSCGSYRKPRSIAPHASSRDSTAPPTTSGRRSPWCSDAGMVIAAAQRARIELKTEIPRCSAVARGWW